ncbi:CMD domain protein [Terrarubrum flagellatum]|uniref:CMD domain protein n=1 Tax=Terrirubrum flagellatum TaxID=2895980 RepID=UPI003144E052
MAAATIIESLAETAAGTPLGEALVGRAAIIDMSQRAHDAVLRPCDPGGLSYLERAAVAERMARHHGDARLAAHYASLLGEAAPEAVADLRDPRRLPAEARAAAIARHADLLTLAPRDATRASIDALRDAGVSEPDIVRLSELAAFVNYQARVIAGLRALQGAA